MGFEFKPVEYNCTDTLIPRYLERAGRGRGGFLVQPLESGAFYEIIFEGRAVGFLSAAASELKGFYVDDNECFLAPRAFHQALTQLKINCAEIASFDSALIALSCPYWKKAQVSAHCYRLPSSAVLKTDNGAVLRCAAASDAETLCATGYFQRGACERLIENHCVYVLEIRGQFAGFGTVEPVRYNEGRAEVGVFVCDSFRLRGLGSSVLARMSGICLDYGLQPTALALAGNDAFIRALESTGFVSFDKLLKVTF